MYLGDAIMQTLNRPLIGLLQEGRETSLAYHHARSEAGNAYGRQAYSRLPRSSRGDYGRPDRPPTNRTPPALTYPPPDSHTTFEISKV
jgi:hypothetical protein